jgi:mRNA-degrading endonuclease RelE of RelBE toxin-antitoxin system
MIVKVSQKGMKSLALLPKDVQVKARKAVEYLKSKNESLLKTHKLTGGRNLYSGKVTSKYRVIYSKTKDTITIVDIIKVDTVVNVMRSEL